MLVPLGTAALGATWYFDFIRHIRRRIAVRTSCGSVSISPRERIYVASSRQDSNLYLRENSRRVYQFVCSRRRARAAVRRRVGRVCSPFGSQNHTRESGKLVVELR
jgi:hypothetical protein